MTLINQPSAAPTRKLTWAGCALLLSQVIATMVMQMLPPETVVDSALLIQTLNGLFTTVAPLVTGYMVRDRA